MVWLDSSLYWESRSFTTKSFHFAMIFLQSMWTNAIHPLATDNAFCVFRSIEMNSPVGWWRVLDAELYSNSIKFFPSCAYELRRSVVQQTRDKNFVFHFFICANVHTTQRPVCTLRAGESQYQSRVAVIIPSWSVVGAGSQGERERHVHRGSRDE